LTACHHTNPNDDQPEEKEENLHQPGRRLEMSARTHKDAQGANAIMLA